MSSQVTNQSINFSRFLKYIKEGRGNISELLNLKEASFIEVPYSELLNNPTDIALGLHKVQIQTTAVSLSIFEKLFIKHYDDGRRQYYFDTTTKDYDTVLEMARNLSQVSTKSFFDGFDKEGIADVLAGEANYRVASLCDVNNYSIHLWYELNPQHQLWLSITEHPIKTKGFDASVRRKGTILDLLTLDLPALLATKEIKRDLYLKDGDIEFIDYTYFLNTPELDAFDIAKIRIYAPEKEYSRSHYIYLNLSSSQEIPLNKKIEIADTLIKMYGMDHMGYEELSFIDLDCLEENSFWVGRWWPMNDIHGLANITKMEKDIYAVHMGLDEEIGLNLSISNYGQLEEYFRAC